MSNLPLLKEFLSYMKENNYSEESIYNYKRDLETFKNFLGKEGIEFQEINKTTINNYKHYLISPERKTAKKKKISQTLSASSINRALSGLRVYLRYLINLGYNSPISPQIIKLVRVKRRRLQDTKLKDQIELIEAPTKFEKNQAVALRNRAMLETIFSTAVRISELINLKLDQIDNDGRILLQGRGKKKRFIYLTPRAQRHIRNYLKVRGRTPSPYLFVPYRGKNVSKKDKKISPNYLQEKIKKYRELLGIGVLISAHSLRYAFNTYLEEEIKNPPFIQSLKGHKSFNATTPFICPPNRYSDRYKE